MKTLVRGVYIWSLYVFALPLMLIGMLLCAVYYLCNICMRASTFGEYVAFMKGYFEGLKEGHQNMMHWVKTGETLFEKILRESQES